MDNVKSNEAECRAERAMTTGEQLDRLLGQLHQARAAKEEILVASRYHEKQLSQASSVISKLTSEISSLVRREIHPPSQLVKKAPLRRHDDEDEEMDF